MKFEFNWQVVPKEMFENVDGRKDDRVIDLLLAYLRDFGSGELINI